MTCSIIADHKSEERYSKLSLAYNTEEEHQLVEEALAECTKLCRLKPNIYAGAVTEGKRMITIEYWDDYDREGGEVFEAILKKLGIDKCH